MSSGILVIGSANLDLVYRVPRIPGRGETLLATGATQNPGGKGNNQVIAAARAGGHATFIAALGTDAAAAPIRDALAGAHVVDLTRRVVEPTGTALITVDDAAENTIVVNSGANATLINLTAEELGAIAHAGYLLMQLETPVETISAAAAAAHAAGTIVVLNAAPARELPTALLRLVDVLVVNEHEALIVAAGLGASALLPAEVTADNAAAVGNLLRSVVESVVITLGGDGSVVVDGDGDTLVPAELVTAIDTTGAGDTLCGVLVAGLAEGMTLVEAVRFATAAAALSVQRVGAVPSIPLRAEIDAFRSAAGPAIPVA